MTSEFDWSESSDEEYIGRASHRHRRKRRRKTYRDSPHRDESAQISSQHFTIAPLLDALSKQSAKLAREADTPHSFEQIIEDLLPDYTEVEDLVRTELADSEESGELVRPLNKGDTRRLLDTVSLTKSSMGSTYASAILARKLKLRPGAFRQQLLGVAVSPIRNGPTNLLSTIRTVSAANPQVIDGLYAIQTTPYERSFLSRLQGSTVHVHSPDLIAVDWETRSPWMDLMSEIRDHYSLAHPEREQLEETVAPIEYASLQPFQLDQVHDLLRRTFWEGINVSDSLEYSPDKCTIIATYKHLVVGAAFLSSPQETYITYLAVRAGWENAQIATTMLYHLIMLNPHKDITLHVSVNNPAMLLYNRFGFKAEEFVLGFYEDYLDPHSRASKNAFRLRLRR